MLLAMLAVLVVGALVQRQFLPPSRDPELLDLWTRVSLLGGAVWVIGTPIAFDLAAPAMLPARAFSWCSRPARTLLAVGTLAFVFGCGALAEDINSTLGGWLWLLGVLGLLSAFVVREVAWPVASPLAWTSRLRFWDWVGLANVALAFALRLVWPEYSPAFFNFDEAQTMDWALSSFHHWAVPGYTVITPMSPFQTTGYLESPNGSYYLYLIVMQLVGETIAGLHFTTAVFGGLSVLVTWLFLRDYVRPWAAVAGAFLLTVSHEHLYFSRNGMAIMPVAFIAMAIVWLVLRGLRGSGYLPWLVAGLLLGAGPYFYWSVSAMGPILAVFAGYMVLREGWGFVRTRWSHFALLGVGTVLAFAPMLIWYVGHPGSATQRASAVTFQNNDDYRQRLYGDLSTSEILVEQVKRNMWGLISEGDGTQQHYPIRSPLVDPATGALMLTGIVGFTLTARRPERFLLALYLWVPTLLIVFLTDRPPPMTRLIIVWPALCAALGFVFDRLGGLAQRAGGGPILATLALPLAAGLAYATYWNFDRFFVYYPTNLPADRFTLMAQVANDAGTAVKTYSLGGLDLVFGKEHVHSLARRQVGETVDPSEALAYLPVAELGWRGAQFVLPTNGDAMLARLRSLYPGGEYQQRTNERGVRLFDTYQVDAEQFHAAAPANASWTQPDFTLGRVGKGYGQIYYPAALAVDKAGRVYVADNGNRRIVEYAADGEPVRHVGRPGRGNGEFSNVSAVAVGNDGTVAGVDAQTGLVQIFDADGRWIRRLGGPGILQMPRGVALLPDGSVAVLDLGLPGIVRFDRSGELVGRVGAAGSGPGRFDSLTGMSAGADGTIYTLETSGRVQRFTPDLRYLGDVRLKLRGSAPQGLSFSVADADGGVFYLVNPSEGVIYRYAPDGRLEWTIGQRPDGGSRLIRPVVLTVDPAGSVYAMATEAAVIFRYDVTRRGWR